MKLMKKILLIPLTLIPTSLVVSCNNVPEPQPQQPTKRPLSDREKERNAMIEKQKNIHKYFSTLKVTDYGSNIIDWAIDPKTMPTGFDLHDELKKLYKSYRKYDMLATPYDNGYVHRYKTQEPGADFLYINFHKYLVPMFDPNYQLDDSIEKKMRKGFDYKSGITNKIQKKDWEFYDDCVDMFDNISQYWSVGRVDEDRKHEADAFGLRDTSNPLATGFYRYKIPIHRFFGSVLLDEVKVYF